LLLYRLRNRNLGGVRLTARLTQRAGYGQRLGYVPHLSLPGYLTALLLTALLLTALLLTALLLTALLLTALVLQVARRVLHNKHPVRLRPAQPTLSGELQVGLDQLNCSGDYLALSIAGNIS